jgi:hypothetical protein
MCDYRSELITSAPQSVKAQLPGLRISKFSPVLYFTDVKLKINKKQTKTIRNYQQMRLFVLCLYFLFLVFYPTCFRLSQAHHQGYLRLLFICNHLVHACFCWSSACACELVCSGEDTTTNQSADAHRRSTNTAWTKWLHINNSLRYPSWWAYESPKHVG